jgi:hypothetical protein
MAGAMYLKTSRLYLRYMNPGQLIGSFERNKISRKIDMGIGASCGFRLARRYCKVLC